MISASKDAVKIQFGLSAKILDINNVNPGLRISQAEANYLTISIVARLVGINLPEDKQIVISLTYIYGIGPSTAKKLLAELKIEPTKKTREVSESELTELQAAISKITTEGDLRRKRSMDIKRLQEIGSYRGVRHRKRLPVRGQRTQCNARTRKGHKRQTVAGKKKVAK